MPPSLFSLPLVLFVTPCCRLLPLLPPIFRAACLLPLADSCFFRRRRRFRARHAADINSYYIRCHITPLPPLMPPPLIFITLFFASISPEADIYCL